MKQFDFCNYVSMFFTKYLIEERAVSRNTIKSYRDSMKEFILFMGKTQNTPLNKIKIEHFTERRVKDFILWIQRERKCSPSTVNLRMTGIKAFLKYVQYDNLDCAEEVHKILSIHPLKKPSPQVSYLSIEGITLLLKQPDTSTMKGLRDLAILSLLYESGCRVSELVDLSVSSLSFVHENIILTGKGNKTRLVGIHKNELAILKNYVTRFGLEGSHCLSKPLFSNSRGEKFTRQNISSILNIYAAKARKIDPSLIPEKISPHCIRHSKAMHLVQAKVPIIYIRDILGHSSFTTTEIYAKADHKLKQEAIEKAYRKVTPDTTADWENNEDLISWLEQF